MRHGIRLLGMVAITGSLFAVADSPAGESDPNAIRKPPLPVFEVCRGTARISGSARPGVGSGPLKVRIYLSDIMPRGPVNDQDITAAFEKFLTEKYADLSIRAECRYAWTRDEAEQIRDGEFRAGPGELTFVETGWQYAAPGG